MHSCHVRTNHRWVMPHIWTKRILRAFVTYEQNIWTNHIFHSFVPQINDMKESYHALFCYMNESYDQVIAITVNEKAPFVYWYMNESYHALCCYTNKSYERVISCVLLLCERLIWTNHINHSFAIWTTRMNSSTVNGSHLLCYIWTNHIYRYEYMNIKMYVNIWRYDHMNICICINMWIYEYIWIYEHINTKIYKYVKIWMNGYMNHIIHSHRYDSFI